MPSEYFTAYPIHLSHSPNQTHVKQNLADNTNPIIDSLKCTSPLSTQEENTRLPAAQPSCILDSKLSNLNRDEYIATLIRLTHQSESDLLTYRDVLLRRARQFQECPSGRLIQRRGSRRNPAFVMLAEDCYVLHSFLLGDSSEIHTIFSKAKPSDLNETQDNARDIDEHDSKSQCYTTQNYQRELAHVLENVIDLHNKMQELQNHIDNDSNKIKSLQTEIFAIHTENRHLKNKLESTTEKIKELLQNIENRMYTTIETEKKEILSKTRNLIVQCIQAP